MADEGKEKVGVAKSFSWIAAVAFALMVIIAVGLWGCQRWKHQEGHDQPQTLNIPAKLFAPVVRNA